MKKEGFMKKQLIFFVILVLISTSQIFSQTEEIKTEVIEDTPNACETNSFLADRITIEASNRNEKIFIIFRAGDGEGTKTNARRMTIVRNFLRNNKRWKSDIFIFARGEKVKGQGRVEFYLGSKLFWVALAKKGKIPCMDCCGFDFQNGNF